MAATSDSRRDHRSGASAAAQLYRDALPPGTLLGDYEIVGVLGQGGFGITYDGVHRTLGRRVAIKEFFIKEAVRREADGTVVLTRTTDDPIDGLTFSRLRDTFVREAKIAASAFSHPHLVEGENFIEANGTAYFVMRYVEGQSLADWLKSRSTPPSEAELRPIFEKVFSAIDHLHSRNFMHRDLKPQNIMLRPGGDPVVIDLGASGMGLDRERTTSLGQNSPAYAAPEQLQVRGRHGRYTDIFALGGVLYRCVAGHPPKPPVLDRMAGLSRRTGGADPYVPAAEAAKDASLYRPEFLAAIDRALKLDVEDRPQSIAEFAAALGWDRPMRATAEETRIGDPAPRPLSESPTAVEKPLPERPRRRAAAALAVIAATLLGGGMVIAADRMGIAPWRDSPVDPKLAACSGAEAHWASAEAAAEPGPVLDHIARFPGCGTAERAKLRLAAFAAPKPAADRCAGAEADWRAVAESADPDRARAHLATFGGCPTADIAAARLKALLTPPPTPDPCVAADAAWPPLGAPPAGIEATAAFLAEHGGCIAAAERARARIAALSEEAKRQAAAAASPPDPCIAADKAWPPNLPPLGTIEALTGFLAEHGRCPHARTRAEAQIAKLTKEMEQRAADAAKRPPAPDPCIAANAAWPVGAAGPATVEAAADFLAQHGRCAAAAERARARIVALGQEALKRAVAAAAPPPAPNPCIAADAEWPPGASGPASIPDVLVFLGKHRACSAAEERGRARIVELYETELRNAAVALAPPVAPPAASACPDGVVAKVATAPRCLQPGEVFKDCATCPEMVVVPGGSFLMGSPPGEPGRFENEGPQHRVNVKPVAIGRYEVTVAQFREFADKTGYRGGGCKLNDSDEREDPSRTWRDPGADQLPNHPVRCVSWADAQAYVKWLNRSLSGREDGPYRLPSEAEWEYAARAGTTTRRPWGDDPQDRQACGWGNVADQTAKTKYRDWKTFSCEDDYVEVAPVGKFEPNRFGLHDMIGNVAEWVADCWNPNYQGAPADGSAWVRSDCSARVHRGTAFGGLPSHVRTALRQNEAVGSRLMSLGFRLARTLSP